MRYGTPAFCEQNTGVSEIWRETDIGVAAIVVNHFRFGAMDVCGEG